MRYPIGTSGDMTAANCIKHHLSDGVRTRLVLALMVKRQPHPTPQRAARAYHSGPTAPESSVCANLGQPPAHPLTQRGAMPSGFRFSIDHPTGLRTSGDHLVSKRERYGTSSESIHHLSNGVTGKRRLCSVLRYRPSRRALTASATSRPSRYASISWYDSPNSSSSN